MSSCVSSPSNGRVSCTRISFSTRSGAAFRAAAHLADKFLDYFQAPGTARDGYIRRLTLAIACTSATGKPKDTMLPGRVIRVAEMYRLYLTAPADKRGGTI